MNCSIRHLYHNLQPYHQLRLPPEPGGLHPPRGAGGPGRRAAGRQGDQLRQQTRRGEGAAEHRDRRQEEHGDQAGQQQHHPDHPAQGGQEGETPRD